MFGAFFVLLVGFQVKHFIADYLLQEGWMIAGKASLNSPGGYAHAGIHVAGSLIVLLLVHTPLLALALLLVAEFVIHYGLDYSKVGYSRGIDQSRSPKQFWGLHGLDQLLHQLTYAGMIYFAMRALGYG